MKKLLCIAYLGLTILGCKTEPKTDYVINGTAEGLYNGIRVYLNKMDERGRMISVDTAIIMKEKFVLNGSLDHPSLYFLTVNGINGRLPIILENSQIEININDKNLMESEILGLKSNEKLIDFRKRIETIKSGIKELSISYRQAKLKNDTLKSSELDNKINIESKKLANIGLEYIRENLDDYSAIEVFKNELRRTDVDIEMANELFNKMPAEIRNTSDGEIIKKRIDQLLEIKKLEKATAIGVKAPEFSAPTPNGELLALSDVVSKGKITIVDFWAAWCGPCRRENPNVVKVYEKFHDKGLEIIGVGLDGRRGQQNPKEAWLKAIEDDKLTWHQVSNLNYFDEIAKKYNVNAIPAMFVLDNEGKIIAKNLRGPALEKKIEELLN
ncbi:peroxiredoxin [Winogradskyella wandonensis]|uniref:Peroxiredoxin n=1 Tax=Winogradskyella wandonensis TaxID=1442586 RepID=A0A4V2PU82_9FLAO|nr:TlpA disulfide reductase family protein [Winogradskyella wandonensis]TCK69451.1 peroxiredoxin [Winogradskyella wandonensis]